LIVFDLDDTLIDTSGVITPFKMHQILELLIKRGISIGNLEIAHLALLALSRECLTSKEAILKELERYGATHLVEEVMALYKAPLPDTFQVKTTPNAKKVLHDLRERGDTLAIVTGGSRAFQLEKLEKAGLQHSLFSRIEVPEDSKKKKHYESLLQEFSVCAQDSVVVGDRISMDLLPAKELGFRTIHMRWGRGLFWPVENWIDHSIGELSELLELYPK